MVLMPAVCAFFRQAAPVSESRLTISRTWTPSLIMFSQMVANLALSPLAFWMSEPMLAASKALLSNGRSFASHRGEVEASGRITPTLPVAVFPPPVLLGLSLPQAARPSVLIAATASRASLFVRMCKSFRCYGRRFGPAGAAPWSAAGPGGSSAGRAGRYGTPTRARQQIWPPRGSGQHVWPLRGSRVAPPGVTVVYVVRDNLFLGPVGWQGQPGTWRSRFRNGSGGRPTGSSPRPAEPPSARRTGPRLGREGRGAPCGGWTRPISATLPARSGTSWWIGCPAPAATWGRTWVRSS